MTFYKKYYIFNLYRAYVFTISVREKSGIGDAERIREEYRQNEGKGRPECING